MENKLMVLNIPWDVNTEGLREYINQFGPLNDCVVIKEHFGYVTFSSTEDAKKALESEHFLGNRTLTVMVATPKEEMRGPAKKATRIFVARIPPSVTETMFREYFKEYGEITDIYMPKVQPSKEHRGIGFITYESADSVNAIMAKSHELGGSTVGVDLATPKDDDARYPSRMVPGGYYAYNAYISGATRYAALGAPTLYDHPAASYGNMQPYAHMDF